MSLAAMADLAGRWGVTANTVSRRLSFLGIKPIRQGNYRFITADQLALGDELQQHVLSGKPMDWFDTSKQKTQMTTSKRMNCVLRAWYVRPETADRLKAYVNRRQESGEAIDASDVVEQALQDWFDTPDPGSASVKPEETTLEVTAKILVDQDRDQWGKWVFKSNLTLLWDGWYEIDLEQINSTAQLCDWIFHCWHRDGSDLIEAFRDIFHPCANCCSYGVEKEFSGSKLAAAYAARFKPPVNKAPVPPKLRYQILKRDNFSCQACGAQASAETPLHVDHIVPRKHGGTNDPLNLQTLCATCNLGKGADL